MDRIQHTGIPAEAAARGEYCAGPVAFIGYDLTPVDLRAELSYMVPTSYYAFGNALSVGLTLAAPTQP